MTRAKKRTTKSRRTNTKKKNKRTRKKSRYNVKNMKGGYADTMVDTDDTGIALIGVAVILFFIGRGAANVYKGWKDSRARQGMKVATGIQGSWQSAPLRGFTTGVDPSTTGGEFKWGK